MNFLLLRARAFRLQVYPGPRALAPLSPDKNDIRLNIDTTRPQQKGFHSHRLLCTGLLLCSLPNAASGTQAFAAPNSPSRYLHAKVDVLQPGLAELSIDALGTGTFPASPLRPNKANQLYQVRQAGRWTRYYKAASKKPAWEIEVQDRWLILRSRYAPGIPADDIVFNFDPDRCHATLLGRTSPDGGVSLPAVLHLPGMGSLRITATGDPGVSLSYHSSRHIVNYVTVGLRAADREHRDRSYRFEVVSFAPTLSDKSGPLPLEALRRDFLDGLQINAELHVLANNAASDPCPFTLYEAADIALFAPPLADGLRALDLVRDTLDRYASGFKGYGMPNFHMFDSPGDHSTQPYTFSDVYPSLLISAFDYIKGTGDTAWLKANYGTLQQWAAEMLQTSSPETGLIYYPVSGNSGSWSKKITVRPANWWDTIGFGHEDAWSNALAFRALRSLAALADMQNDLPGAARYRERAALIKAHYAPTFFNPSTGLIAGWKSADGKLHDYEFLFVNGAAIRYGLLDPAMEKAIAAEMLKRIAEAGYTRFDLGLPGNLKPVRREDYPEPDHRFGASEKDDGSDGFQIYENGGATAAFSYFTIAALYQTAHQADADRMLIPMLNAFAKQGFSGRGTNGMTNDWKDWQGNPNGYEGFLADNYYAILCVLEREHRGPAVP